MPDGTTGWFDHTPVDITHDIDREVAAVPLANLINHQWEDVPGEDLPVRTSAIIDYDTSVAVLREMEDHLMGSGGSGDFARAFFDNNWEIESHWIWTDTYNTTYAMDVAVLPIVDDDGHVWRLARQNALIDQWEADHPGSFVTSFEWEGNDGTTQLGSHTDRRVSLTYHGFEPDYNRFIEGTGDLYRREDYQSPPNPPLPNPLEPDIDFYSAPLELGVEPAVVQYNYTGNGESTSLMNWRWTPRSILDNSALIYSLPSVLGVYDISIPDAEFEANAVPLVRQFTPSRHSRGMILMGIPRLLEIIEPEARYDAPATAFNLQLTSTYQPPRYRMNFFRDVTPYRRNVPARHDGLSGGACRNYPPSNTVHTGNRNVGGVL